MDAVRQQRAIDLAPRLRENLGRLGAWHKRRIEQINGERVEHERQGRTLPAPTRRRLEQEKQYVQRIKQERHDWITQVVTTNPNAYLRIAAVLVSA
jgi:hypothetical protein